MSVLKMHLDRAMADKDNITAMYEDSKREAQKLKLELRSLRHDVESTGKLKAGSDAGVEIVYKTKILKLEEEKMSLQIELDNVREQLTTCREELNMVKAEASIAEK